MPVRPRLTLQVPPLACPPRCPCRVSRPAGGAWWSHLRRHGHPQLWSL